MIATSLAAQPNGGQDLANLREDLRLLSQRVGELSLRVEQLEHENETLRGQQTESGTAYASLAQLNDAIAELNRSIKGNVSNSRAEILKIVSGQIEQLANQTNTALESLAKGGGKGTTGATKGSSAFSDNYPTDGISYTVVKGDSLARIAHKTGAKVSDIINANKISDPSKILSGQVLFIPGGK